MTTRLLSVLLFVMVMTILTPRYALADAALVVNTIVDENGTGTNCSLREAITAANTNADYGGCVGSGNYGADSIGFDTDVFATNQVITLTSALPNLSDDLIIEHKGNAELQISGNGLAIRIFTIDSGVEATLQITFILGSTGGGILNNGALTILNSAIFNNSTTQDGGGVLNNGSLTVVNSTFRINYAGEDGGGIFNSSSGTVRVMNATFFDNRATNDGYSGGGIFNNGNMIVTNSTFTNNKADSRGGAVDNLATLTLVNSTINNSSTDIGYSGVSSSGTLAVYNSIVAKNTSSATPGSPEDVECYSTGTLTIHNTLVEDGSCGITSGVNGNLMGDPLIGSSSSNGGLTQTHRPLAGSPVINAGSNSYLKESALSLDFNSDGDMADTLTTDQRGTGYDRIVTTTVDMGAVEYHLLSSSANAAPQINYSTSNTRSLTWNPITWATGYQVQISSNSTFTALACGGTLADNASPMTTCYLSPQKYYWRVRATSSGQTGAWSRARTFVVGIVS